MVSTQAFPQKRPSSAVPPGAGERDPGGDRARAPGGLSAPAPPRGGGAGGGPPCATPHRGDGLGAQGELGWGSDFWGDGGEMAFLLGGTIGIVAWMFFFFFFGDYGLWIGYLCFGRSLGTMDWISCAA